MAFFAIRRQNPHLILTLSPPIGWERRGNSRGRIRLFESSTARVRFRNSRRRRVGMTKRIRPVAAYSEYQNMSPHTGLTSSLASGTTNIPLLRSFEGKAAFSRQFTPTADQNPHMSKSNHEFPQIKFRVNSCKRAHNTTETPKNKFATTAKFTIYE